MTPVSLTELADQTRLVADRFRSAGHRVYLVGGVIRDVLAGRVRSHEADLDLTTDADPEQIKRIITPLADVLWLQGERFGTIGARIEGRAYEITTHRSEHYHHASRKPTVSFSTALDEDLSRRDFTVNAMAVELPDARLIDPFGGEADLTHGRLDTPLDPAFSFTDDPLRMLRAARFAAGYGLAPTDGVVAAMERLRDRLEIVSAERLRDELDKLLAVDTPSPGLDLLNSTGLWRQFMPEVDATRLAHRGPAIDAMEPSALVRLAALFFGTDLSSVRARLSALRYSNERQRTTVDLLRAAADLAAGLVVDPPGFRRWAAADPGVLDQARTLVAVLVDDGERVVAVSRALEDALGPELHDLGPALTGGEVMDTLQLREGPVVGEALAFLVELRFEEGPMTPDEARHRLIHWWDERGRR